MYCGTSPVHTKRTREKHACCLHVHQTVRHSNHRVHLVYTPNSSSYPKTRTWYKIICTGTGHVSTLCEYVIASHVRSLGVSSPTVPGSLLCECLVLCRPSFSRRHASTWRRALTLRLSPGGERVRQTVSHHCETAPRREIIPLL